MITNKIKFLNKITLIVIILNHFNVNIADIIIVQNYLLKKAFVEIAVRNNLKNE